MSLESQTILLAISAAFVSAATNITFAPALRQMGSFALAQFNNLGNTVMLGGHRFSGSTRRGVSAGRRSPGSAFWA